MKTGITGAATALAGLLSACGGGGDSGSGGGYSCAYMPGEVRSTSVATFCQQCTTENPDAVADRNQGSYAAAIVPLGQRTTTITDTYSGPGFPVGSKAGALMSFLGGASVESVTLTTLQDGVQRESFSGAALSTTSTGGATAATTYVWFETTLEFNSLQIVVNATSGNEFRIYEFCGDS
ncbi:hypothetical protein AAG565_14910 [Fontimonas sp. SYSU GA230001]|uniref:hypothetical protein n=1 Tax=Fontimonas sp. SYSU GA230001 TaxID=3142450 RepID=UPI0032B445E0